MSLSAHARAAPERPPLRVGLLVDSLRQPAWVDRALQDILESRIATLALVVVNAGQPPDCPPGGRLARWYGARRFLLHELYTKIDARKFAMPDDPFRPVAIDARLTGVPVVEVTPRRTKHCDYLADEDVERILAHDLDVAIRLGFRILRGRFLEIARHGVWSYHHGDNRVNRGGPPGFWEVMEGHPVTGTVLQVLTEEIDAGRVIYRSYSSTAPLSVLKNRHAFYWKASTFISRKLRELHERGPGALRDPEPGGDEPAAYSQRLYVAPSNREMAPLITRLAGRYVAGKVRSLVETEQWFLAYRRSPQPRRGHEPDLAPFRFRALHPPPDRYWADPFPVRDGDKFFVLFEEYLHGTGKGHISALEIGESGPVGAAVPVLQPAYHLSYPYTFDWRGERFMVPESIGNRTVEAYRATRFPFAWDMEGVLMADVDLVDATIVEIEGRWWLFANGVARGGSPWDELYLYHASSPLGPWTPHRRNPVVSDVRRARPAGRPFSRGGAWYRPAQDCSRGYGYAVRIQRITRLDPEDFEEVTVSILTPDWMPRLVGTHTVNAIDGLTVIDARARRWPWARRGRASASRSAG
jgi:hypothetical protein